MIYTLITIAFVVSVTLSAMIILRILLVVFRKKLFDVPNEQKRHDGIVPRLGGISFAPTILFSLAFTTSIRCLTGLEISQEMFGVVVPEFFFLACGLI